LHVLAAIDRDIGAGHERRPVRAQVDYKTCNFFGLAEASERDLRQVWATVCNSDWAATCCVGQIAHAPF